MSHCRVYWGSHGCYLGRGHKGPHRCQCADDPDAEDEDGDAVNVGAFPYYGLVGAVTNFYGEDVRENEFQLLKKEMHEMQTHTNDHLKDDEQLLVEIFMAKAHQEIPVRPTMPDLKTRQLRARLMLEEVLETINLGLGLEVQLKSPNLNGTFDVQDLAYVERSPGDLIQIADGCCDVNVVTKGTGSACGIALRPCFKLVSGNNLMKFAPGHTFRSDGKLVKPPNHPNIDVDLARELARQEFGSSLGIGE